MIARRLITLAAFLSLTLPAVQADSDAGLTAPVLTEVTNHLNEAQRCFDTREFAMANAHADMVLLHEDMRVFVKFQNVPPEIQPNATKAMHQAFKGWQEALNDTVSFKLTDDEANAEIVIRFKPDVRMGREAVAGFANWKRVIDTDKNGKIVTKFTSDLQIRTMTLDWKPMASDSMRHEMMHEIGHVLGLEDTKNSQDIMGPLDMNHPVACPRPNEARAVSEIRSQAQRIQSDIREQIG